MALKKKGMHVGELYPFVLTLVLVGMLIGVGVLALDKFSTSTGMPKTTRQALNDSRDAVGAIGSTWMSLVVTIGVLSLIIALVIRGFSGGRE